MLITIIWTNFIAMDILIIFVIIALSAAHYIVRDRDRAYIDEMDARIRVLERRLQQAEASECLRHTCDDRVPSYEREEVRDAE